MATIRGNVLDEVSEEETDRSTTGQEFLLDSSTDTLAPQTPHPGLARDDDSSLLTPVRRKLLQEEPQQPSGLITTPTNPRARRGKHCTASASSTTTNPSRTRELAQPEDGEDGDDVQAFEDEEDMTTRGTIEEAHEALEFLREKLKIMQRRNTRFAAAKLDDISLARYPAFAETVHKVQSDYVHWYEKYLLFLEKVKKKRQLLPPLNSHSTSSTPSCRK